MDQPRDDLGRFASKVVAETKQPEVVATKLPSTEEEYVAIGKKLIESQTCNNHTWGFSFGNILESGRYDPYGGACYSNVSCSDGRARVFLDHSMSSNRVEKKLKYEYIDWWVNRSFASKAFLIKDVDFIGKYNGVLISMEVPAYYAITAGIGLRYLREYPQIVERWGLFKDIIGEDAAIFPAHCLYQTGDQWGKAFMEGHCWFSTDALDAFKVAVSKTPQLDHAKPFRESAVYSPLNRWNNAKSRGWSQDRGCYPFPNSNSGWLKNSLGKLKKYKDDNALRMWPESKLEWLLTEYVKIHSAL